MNHLLFDHDIYVLGPYISGFQGLLKIFCDYAAEQEVFLTAKRELA